MFENGTNEWTLPYEIKDPTDHGHVLFAKPLDNIKVEVIGGMSENTETGKERKDVRGTVEQNDDNPCQYDFTLRTQHGRKGEFRLKVLTEFEGKTFSWESPTVAYEVPEKQEAD